MWLRLAPGGSLTRSKLGGSLTLRIASAINLNHIKPPRALAQTMMPVLCPILWLILNLSSTCAATKMQAAYEARLRQAVEDEESGVSVRVRARVRVMFSVRM